MRTSDCSFRLGQAKSISIWPSPPFLCWAAASTNWPGRFRRRATDACGGSSLFSRPDIILFDEISLGLAPILLDEIFNSVQNLASTGVSIIIVEQYVDRVLALADTAYILVRGQISWNGPATGVTEEVLAKSYLGRST